MAVQIDSVAFANSLSKPQITYSASLGCCGITSQVSVLFTQNFAFCHDQAMHLHVTLRAAPIHARLQMRTPQLQWLAPAPMEGVSNVGISFLNPKTPGQHGLFLSRDLFNSEIQQGAIKRCRRDGGIHSKIVVSTGKPGYFAIAVSHEQDRRIVGWSGPQSSAEAAANEALAKCKDCGGTDPNIKAQWHDYYHSFDKHVA